eukprot:4322261-Prymnesium_polylepis.1
MGCSSARTRSPRYRSRRRRRRPASSNTSEGRTHRWKSEDDYRVCGPKRPRFFRSDPAVQRRVTVVIMLRGTQLITVNNT